ncbi:cysteine--tRNA ligase [Nitrosomonas marina]|uniref:Cysteine--tRNA ligase n=1 Tax=Nitrosomonas marina TaxID=917 RepID=A0A1H8DBP8_9PROT|nr:cysteine--tRNA ligase [Nitrosomonas marina]SEN04586.1 cysteinyl-tRNA synthetase [Nitrosomonas marina]
MNISTPPIQLYNTLTRCKTRLETARPNRITMYVCGPTVYNYAHIGNARPAVVFDVLARLLRGYFQKVLYARNFTDIDDKINAAAAETGLPIQTITSRYIDAYHDDMQALGVLPPDHEPRVTDHIPDILDLIQRLLTRGHAYVAQEHVLFDVSSYPQYGQLSRRQPEDMQAGARIEIAPYKRDPLDFVLWKPSTPDQPGWDSPWGRGRPGWHIECSAMIGRYFGDTIDIHGGGQDLIFPHHENEIAQGTCAHDGRLYCRTWVHNSFVTVDGQKMSKSLGNILLVRDLLNEAPGEAIRLALLSTRYRHPLDWGVQRLATARRILSRFYTSLAKVASIESANESEADETLLHALCNDLNTPLAIARLHELANVLDTADSGAAKAIAKGQLLASAGLLGLLQQEPLQALQALQFKQESAVLPAARIETLLAERNQARKAHDFERADAIRAELELAGVLIADTPQGTTWRQIKT